MNSNVQVLFTGAAAPVYARPGDAGADLCANESTTVPAGQRAIVGTGLSIALPDGFVGLVHPRSGLALHSGITVLNTPGTIDAGYRGEIKVILFNTSDQDFTIRPGDRIAQLVVQRFERAEFVEVERLPGSARASQGFGSTGV
ncbi:dUTP diphosphatase [Pseudoclavibacter sp. 13-3]|uniref:dUTP diphosphatase n=1 Tax=Pseudoclavibacter sp. 13-3 TaxID=2901228 RepID=UPI001E3BA221|nr:dUTP diphosphatase [Pseudoclavibacter sp. 13-3]